MTSSSFFLHQTHGVENRGPDDDGGAVLIIMENGDRHTLSEPCLDFEALRRLDVLQVYSTKGRLQARDDIDESIHVGLVDFDIENVDTGEFFEQNSFTLHDRLGRQGADGAESEHSRAVADHAHEVAPGRQLGGILRVRRDGVAGRGNTRRVSKGEVLLGAQGLGGGDSQLSRHRVAVIVEGAFVEVFCHDYFPGARR